MTDNNKSYYVQLPDKQRGEIWDADKYSRNQQQLFNDHPDAIVLETSPFTSDTEPKEGEFYSVHLPGYNKAEMWDADKLARNKEKLLKDHPDVNISRGRTVDYWGDRLRETDSAIAPLEKRLGEIDDELSSPDIRVGGFRRADAVRLANEKSDIGKQLEGLYADRDNNYLYRKQREAQAKMFEDEDTKLNEMQKQLSDENPDAEKARRASLVGGGAGPLAASAQVFYGKDSDPEFNRDAESLALARIYLDEAKKTAFAPSKGDKSNGFANFFRGLQGAAPESISVVNLIKTGLDMHLVDAIKKIQETAGEDANIFDLVKSPDKLTYLSSAEKELVKAFCIKSAVDADRAGDLSIGYQAGDSAMRSLGFMADFLMFGGEGSLANAAGKKATEGLLKATAKASNRLALKGMARKAALAPAKFGIGTLEAAVKTAVMTPMMPSSWTNLTDNLLSVNDAGQVDLSGKAILNAIGDTFIENLSENAGEQVEAIIDAPFKLAGKAMSKVIPETKFTDWAKIFRNSGASRLMRDAAWHGYFGEIGEEWYGNALRVMTGVDKDALKNFATVDQQLITLISFAPMSVFGMGTSAGQYLSARKGMNKSAERLSALLSQNGYDEAQIKDILDVTKAENPTQLAAKLSPVITQVAEDNATEDSGAQIYRAVCDYAQAVARYRVFDGIHDADVSDQRNAMANELSDRAGLTSIAQTHDAGNGVTYETVRTLTDPDTGPAYVVGEQDGKLAIVQADNGRKYFIPKEQIGENVIDSGEMPLNDFLDREIARKRSASEAERIETDRKQQAQEIFGALNMGDSINVGTEEDPAMGMVIAKQPDGRTVIQLPDGSVNEYTPSEIGNLIGKPISSKTDEQIETEAADAEQEVDDAVRWFRDARYSGDAQGLPFVMADGSTVVINDVRRGESTGSVTATITTSDGQETTAELPAKSVNEAILGNSAVTDEAETKDDSTPRDFRGNPLPLKEDGNIDQTALWNNDPEAWAMWNDSVRNDGGENSLAYIETAAGKLKKDIKNIDKEYAKTTDFDKRDSLEGTRKNLQERLAALDAVRARYAERQNAEAAAKMQAGIERAKEARKAKADELAKYNTESLEGINKKWEDAPKDIGTDDVIVLPNGEEVGGNYVLTEAFAPTPSHDTEKGYAKTEGFPIDENGQTVNDRDYEHDKEAQRQVEQKAAAYDQRALQTPVVVSSDGVVLSGNDRTMASQLAARQGTDTKYNEYLAKHPQKYGFTAEQVAKYSNPRVVFVPTESMPYTASTFAKFNAEEKKTQSKTESAVKAGKTITPETVATIAQIIDAHESIAETYADEKAVAAIIRALVDAGTVQENEISRLMDGNLLSGTGEDLVESVLLGAVMREDALRCAMGDKAIRRSIMSALTQLLKNNTYGEYSLSGEFSDAVVLLYQAKHSGLVKGGESIANYMNQPVLEGFGENPLAASTVQMIANTINGTKVNGLKNVLSLYNAKAEMAASGQADLFLGDVETKEQIIREILNEYGYDTETFTGEQQQSTAAAAEQLEQQPEQSEQGSSEEQAPDAVSGDAGSSNEITPEQSSLPGQPNSDQYPTERESSDSKSTQSSETKQENAEISEGRSIQGLEGYSREQIKGIVSDHIRETLSDAGINAEIVGVEIHGSRNRGNAREDSDLDIVVEYRGDIREDDMFNTLNDAENQLVIDGIKVDINPIRAEETGTLQDYMKRSKEYDQNKAEEDFREYTKTRAKEMGFDERIDEVVSPEEDYTGEIHGWGKNQNIQAVRAKDGRVFYRVFVRERKDGHFAKEELLEEAGYYDNPSYRTSDMPKNIEFDTYDEAEAFDRQVAAGKFQRKNVDKKTDEETNLFAEAQRIDNERQAEKSKKGNESVKSKTKKETPEKIEDYGEQIAGARKDMLRDLAKSVQNASLESLISLPFGKAFKKPNLRKAVETGALRESDAQFAQSIIAAFLSTKKPVAGTKDERRKQRWGQKTDVQKWAEKAYTGVKILQELFNADEETRDRVMQAALAEKYVGIEEAKAEQKRISELNGGREFNGTSYPLNLIALYNEVFNRLGYPAGQETKIPVGKVAYSSTFDSYSLRGANGKDWLMASRELKTFEDVVDEMVYLIKVANADETADHPVNRFKRKGINVRTRVSGYRVLAAKKISLLQANRFAVDEIFPTEEEALKRIEELKSQGMQCLTPIAQKERIGYEKYEIVFDNPLTNEYIPLGKEYETAEEAAAAPDAEHDELNRLANEAIAAESKKHGDTAEKSYFHIISYYEKGEDGKYHWYYGIALDDKYGPKKTAFNTMPFFLAEHLNSHAEAQKMIDENKAKWEGLVKNIVRQRSNFVYFSGENASRQGEDYRKGKDVTAEEFAKQFGFRGVQFGNWANQADRQAALNNAYDSFMDMAKIIGVSPRAMSLDGELGIAFGSRGSGAASAHYEPGEVVINLTKTRGAGALAHEWWHALDNYFSRSANVKMGYVTSDRRLPMREEMRGAFNRLIDDIEKSDYHSRSTDRGASYWGTREEETARLFEVWIADEMIKRGERNAFLAEQNDAEDSYAQMGYAFYKAVRLMTPGEKVMSFDEFKKTPMALKGFVYPTREELETLGKDVRDIFGVVEERTNEETGDTALFQMIDKALSNDTPEKQLAFDTVSQMLSDAGIPVEHLSDDAMRQMAEASQDKGEAELLAHSNSPKARWLNNYVEAVHLVTGEDKKSIRKKITERIAEARREAKELYANVLSGNFNSLTLRQINNYIDNATNKNRFIRPLSQRLPERALAALPQGGRTSAVDALFSRICESTVPANGRTRAEARRAIETRKEELLEGWAKATGNWHESIADFTGNTAPIKSGTDSDVYLSDDGGSVIKASKGKFDNRKFPSDIDQVNLFNAVFPHSAYRILGYGRLNGKFVRFIEQQFVDFSTSQPLTTEERVEYMRRLGFEPRNEEKTIFSNGEIVVSDLQKSNIVKDTEGNIRVIDADVKLHTKDIGGNYTYPPVETDTEVPEFMTVYHGSGAKFDRFDHSHMGEGEGEQAFGWGTYVTDVRDIGISYANKGRNAEQGMIFIYNGEKIGYSQLVNKLIDIVGGYHIITIRSYIYIWGKEGAKEAKDYLSSQIKLFKSWRNKEQKDPELEGLIKQLETLAQITGIRKSNKKNNANLYTVDIPENRGNNYLDWDKKINETDILTEIDNKLCNEEGWRRVESGGFTRLTKGEDTIVLNPNATGADIYEELSVGLGSPKTASEFLNSLGYIGISYPAEYMSGGRRDGTRNYVIFDENNAKITGRIEFLKNGDTVYGAAVGGKIFLNADRLNPNTPIHEYTHLWDKACKARNPELWKRGVELMKQTSLWKEVENDPNYAGLDEDGIAGEVHARLSGEHGAETLERLSKEAIDENGNLAEAAMKASVIGRLRKWLSEFWHWVKDTMTPWSREEAEKVSIEDFINMPLADLAKGTKLNDNQYNSEERDIIDNAKKDGTFMKAPNGNPTNLNERQWVQVRTEAFKEWFGDWENDPENASKAVDENGEPKVLYHGGPYRFFRFDPARLGQSTDANSAREGFFFTDSQDLADVFAENSLKTLPEDDLDSLVEARINEMTGDELEDAYIAYRNEDDSYQDYIDETESPSDEDFLKDYNYDYGEGYKDGMSLDDARRAFLWNAIATKLYGGYFSDIEDIAEELSTVGVNLGNTEAVFLNLRTPAVDEVERDYFHDGEDIAPMTPTLKEAKEDGRDGAIFTGITENGQEGPAFQYVVFNPNQIKSAVENSGKFSADNDDIRFSIVTDKDEIDRLNSKPTIKVYRAMQLVNGKLYPPMSGKVNGKWRDGIAVEDLGKVWEKADENPELADDKGRFTLNKGNGTTLKARYNPYIHTSTTPLNDQFSSAQSRPELVTVEVEIPKSELTSGYKADKAKDSVGKVEWKAGVVQGKLSGTRTVILSRWDKPVRIVPESEVADKIVEMFDGKDITMPSNVVTPALRAELERRGVPFVETDNQGKPTETTVRFREDGKSLFKAMQDNAEVLTPRQLTKEIWNKEVNGKTFNTPVGEVRLGSNQYVKNIKKGREKEFGMLIPTIERPDIIFEENAPEPGAERQTKYAFVKTFVDTNGERHLNYTSISVKKNDMEVVESSHFLRDKQVLNKIEKEQILWNRFASDSALSAQGGSIVQSNALSSRAKVGNKFEKTNESSENQQDIELDREGERSYDSVPTSLNHSESGKRYAAEETASAIGVKVEYISRDEMPKGHENAKGMWKDGKIYIALENHPDANDVRRTVLHEAVGHEGLRRLVGERNMNGFCMDVYKALPASERRKIADAALQRYGGDIYEATEEYLAELAEDMDTNKSYDTIWDEIRVKTRNLLSKIGINIPLSRRDIRWILWQSYNANRQGDLINEAQRQVLADRLGFSLRADSLRAKAQEEIRLRSANGTISAANIYSNAVARASKRLHESWVEMTNSVNTLVEAIEKQTGKAAKSFEDIRLALNQQSSKELAAIKAWERDFYNPMMSAIKEMMDAHRLKREEIDRYAFLKHGLERNDVFAKRDAKAYYQSRFEKNVKKINGDKRLSELEKKLKIADAEQVRDSYFADIDAGTDKMYLKFREKDYGGLTALFSTFSPISPQGENETDEEYNARVLASRKPQFATLAETEDAARAEVDAFEKRVGKASITKLWDATNKATKSILKHQYESNMISREQYMHVKDMFKYYVPMRGFADNTASDMYSYYASDKGSITPPLLRAKGRKTQAESPWGYIGAMASTAYAADFKNETKLALFYFISNRPDNDLVRISDVWYEKTSETDPDTGKPVFKQVYPEFKDGLNAAATRQEYDRWEADMEEKRKKGEAYKGTNGIDLQNSVIHIDEAQKNSHIIRFKVRGQEKMLLINGNPRAAQAINNELNIDAAQDGITKGAQKILRWMAGFNTSYNPEFWMSNAQRDLLFSIMATSIKESPEYTRQFIANLGKAVKVIGMIRKDKQGKLGSSYIEKMYKEFVDGGAVTGFTVIKDNEEWEQVGRQFTADHNKAGQAAMQALEAIQDFGEGIEQMTRFAAFLTARENGKSITEAVADAKELTVNFNRKGSGKGISWKESEKLKNRNGEKLNTAERVFYVGASMLSGYGRRFIMFFNASVQGLNTMYQLWTKDKRRTSAWMAGYFALGAINAMLHALLDDDDDYLDMPDYERRNNLLLGGKGNYFKWALPQESRVFYAMGDILVNDMILGRNPQKKTRGVGDILEAVGDIMPINPMNGLRGVVPQALVPAFENLQNEDYKGTKVYNEPRWLSEEEQKRTPKYTMAYSNTGRQFVLLSMGLNYISGGDSTDAGAIDIRPEKMEHLFEGLTGGLGTTLNRFWKSTGGLVIDSAIDANESGMNFGDAIRENASVRNTPFLNRLWVHNDDRYRNVHTSDVFNYYKAEAEHTQNLIRKAKKEGDADLLDRLYDDDKRMNILYIYRGYSGVMKAYDRMLKITDDKAERRQLIQEQDEYRKEMIQEIAEENK